MTQRLVSILLLVGLMTLAVLLYRSTASYPAYVQGSTASYVRFLGLTMGILCAADLLLSFWRQSKTAEGDQADKPGGTNLKRFWALLVLLVVYSLALDPIGFYAASVVFLPLSMYAMGGRRPVPIIATSAGILIFVHLVFVELLEVHLPAGTLF